MGYITTFPLDSEVIMILLSSPPLIITELFKALVMQRTGAMCSKILIRIVKALRSHTIMLVSSDPVNKYCDWRVTDIHSTLPLCPTTRKLSIYFKIESMSRKPLKVCTS